MEEKVLDRENRFYDTAACCGNCNHREEVEDTLYCNKDGLGTEYVYWCNLHD